MYIQGDEESVKKKTTKKMFRAKLLSDGIMCLIYGK